MNENGPPTLSSDAAPSPLMPLRILRIAMNQYTISPINRSVGRYITRISSSDVDSVTSVSLNSTPALSSLAASDELVTMRVVQ